MIPVLPPRPTPPRGPSSPGGPGFPTGPSFPVSPTSPAKPAEPRTPLAPDNPLSPVSPGWENKIILISSSYYSVSGVKLVFKSETKKIFLSAQPTQRRLIIVF